MSDLTLSVTSAASLGETPVSQQETTISPRPLHPLLSVDGLSKFFPNICALQGLQLQLGAGEVLAVVGENGAGKSTLLKVLVGEYDADEGCARLDGEVMPRLDPLSVRQRGFRLVRQEPEIVPHLSVAENIYLNELPGRLGLVHHAELRRRAAALLAQWKLERHVSLDALGISLSPAQRHIVEIARALKPGVRVIAFDEPTSSLTEDETQALFELIRMLKASGLGIIYVSHRLREIMVISDRIAVLRDGQLAGLLDTPRTNTRQVVQLMVGRDLSQNVVRGQYVRDEVVLQVQGLHSPWHEELNFEIRAGEIVGFGGLVGAGRSELAKIIFGALAHQRGQILMEGRALHLRSPRDAIAARIGFAPEDRKGEGLILVRSVLENAALAVLTRLARLGVLRQQDVTEQVAPMIAMLEVKTPSLHQEVGKLSGGNQQKVVLARWLSARPRLLILDEPTRAVDVGTKLEIYALIDRLAREGVAIMLISSELPELLALSDRILVMAAGRLSPSIAKAEASETLILDHALGKYLH